jgi:hypothetical protein
MTEFMTVESLLALVCVLSVGAFILIVIPACVLSGRISEAERNDSEVE